MTVFRRELPLSRNRGSSGRAACRIADFAGVSGSCPSRLPSSSLVTGVLFFVSGSYWFAVFAMIPAVGCKVAQMNPTSSRATAITATL